MWKECKFIPRWKDYVKLGWKIPIAPVYKGSHELVSDWCLSTMQEENKKKVLGNNFRASKGT